MYLNLTQSLRVKDFFQSILNKLSFDDKEYIAGIMDGDGSINCSYNISTTALEPNCIICVSTNHDTILNIQKKISNSYDTSIYTQKERYNWRKASILRVNTIDIKTFLQEITPHLIYRNRQSILLQRILNGLDIQNSYTELRMLNKRGLRNNYEYKLPMNIIENAVKRFTKNNKINQKISKSNKMLKRPAYIAGCLDSDGCISMNGKSNGNVNRSSITISSSVSDWYIDALKNLFHSNNYYYTSSTKASNKKNSKGIYNLHLSGKYRLQFLEEIIPYLNTRLPQALISLKFIKKEIDLEEWKKEINILNQRGLDTLKLVLPEPQYLTTLIESKMLSSQTK